MENEISVFELNQLIENKDEFALIDVREKWERDIAKLPNDIHIPLSNWQSEKIPENKLLIFYCHHGVRSRHVVDQFLQSGIVGVLNLTGGIHKWSLEIDQTKPTY